MIALPFILNSVLNFVVGILVAKLLGPAEFGRYALALSIAVVLQTLGLDWLRLAATRFYSRQDQTERPEVRATLDLSFVAVGGLAAVAAGIVGLSGLDLPLSPQLVALAIGAAVTNALFDTSAALLRARFLDRAYTAFIVAKNVLSFALTIGGAWYFGSAKVALAGLMLSIVGSFVLNHRTLIDRNAGLRLADRRLAMRFAIYGLPIVLANVLYQAVPMLNRGAVSQLLGFEQAGQLAFAFELGIRIIGSLGSALDVLLFQVAVLAEKTFGPAAAREQISRNMGLVFAVISPAVLGCWLVLPSFEAIFVPQSFCAPFGHYFTLMLPAMLCFALTNYCLAPAFQIGHRTLPLIFGGIAAFAANSIAVLVLPATIDASKFALAQTISSCAGFVTIVAFLCIKDPIWPNWRDIGRALLAMAAMAMAVLLLPATKPGTATLLMQAGCGAAVYAAVILTLDACNLRSLLAPRIRAALQRRLLQAGA